MKVRVHIAAVVCFVMLNTCFKAQGQAVCTTPQKMTPQQRQSIGDAAYALASATLNDNAASLRSQTSALAGDFAQIQYTVDNVSQKIQGDSLQVTWVYLLDATKVKAGDDANFSCELTGGTSETDFSISGLTPGVYSFAIVEATGKRPWVLSFLLQQDGASWKMAGLYQHPRTAAGKDGVAYWLQGRSEHLAQPWLAWLRYNEAVTLLSPAPFATTTNLDKLRAEQRVNAPAALSAGVSVETPLMVKSASGTDVRITSLASDATEDGLTLRLVLHYAVTQGSDAQAQDMATVKALLAAHPELRPAFGAVLVFGDIAGQNPSVLSARMDEVSK